MMGVGLTPAIASSESVAAAKVHLPDAPKVDPIPHLVLDPNPRANVDVNGVRGAVGSGAGRYPTAESVGIDVDPTLVGDGAGSGSGSDQRQRGTGRLGRLGASERAVETVEVDVLPPGVADAAGVPGVLFRAAAISGVQRARVEIDYEAFRSYGGPGWSDRLQAVGYPACVLTSPSLEECRTPLSLPVDHDPAASSIAVDLDLDLAGPAPTTPDADATPNATSAPSTMDEDGVAGEAADRGAGDTSRSGEPQARPHQSAMVFALQGGASGGTGDFGATDLNAAGSWGQGGATGGFSWDYGITLPPAGNDTEPDLKLSYNSSAVDGQNTTSNNQSSWVGTGWSLGNGFIERTYRTCADVPGLPATRQTGDLCWAGEIVTMSLPGGGSGALVKDTDTGEWHLQHDNGWKIELLEGADNDLWKGQHWLLTDRSGSRYYFGLNRLPGSTPDDATHSTQRVPVFGAAEGDPCYDASSFKDSKCPNMGYRWNLDYVVDSHGNATVYDYKRERNHYESWAGGSATRIGYDRAAYPKSIRYGLHTGGGGLFATAPQKVEFSTAERCFAGGAVTCADEDFKLSNANWWPDVPVDQACEGTGACGNVTPTFWSRKRLNAITTSYHTPNGYQKVDSYDLKQSFFVNSGDELILDSITRTGWKGTSFLAMPPVKFGMTSLANRVAGLNNLPTMNRARLTSIVNENGLASVISYNSMPGQGGRAPAHCTASTVPASVVNNATLCYPVKWMAFDPDTPLKDFFHKYVVTQVNEMDPNGHNPARLTAYHYKGGAAWHYDDNEVVRPKYRSWGQFRGFGEVETRTGNPHHLSLGLADVQTSTTTSYFRGMHGDRLADGTDRTVSVTDSTGTQHVDRVEWAGRALETRRFNGVGGALVSKAITTPSTIKVTASRPRPGLGALRATIVRDSKTTDYTAKRATGEFLTSTTTNTYDGEGRPTQTLSTADAAATKCTLTSYATNNTTGVKDSVARVRILQDQCTGALLSESRYFYDGSTTAGSVTKGDLTRTETDSSATRSQVELTGYDTYGRQLTSTVLAPGATPATRVTTTTYTPSGVGAVTRIDTQAALDTHRSSSFLDPGRQVVTRAVDAAGLVTEAEYDALGRRTAVWEPGHVRGTDLASTTYGYVLSPTQVTSVTTRTLVDNGDSDGTPAYVTSINLYDAFGSLRQTQADTPSGGRTVTETFNDTHGWAHTTYDGWYTLGAPQTQIIGATATAVARQTHNTYDGVGRKIQSTAKDRDLTGATVEATTTTVYGGDQVTTLPPAGDTATTSLLDGRGQEIEQRDYKSRPTINGLEATGGTYVRQTHAYDAIGQETATTSAAGVSGQEQTWTRTYDLAGQMVAFTTPSSGTTLMSYYDTGEVKTRTDAVGRVTAYDYDALGRTSHRYADHVGGPLLAEWTYDTLKIGYPTTSTSFQNGKSYTRRVTGYDSVGRPLGNEVSLDEPGFKNTYTSTQSWTTTGLLSTSAMPSTRTVPGIGVSSEAIEYDYDILGNPTGMAGNNIYVQDVTYSPFSEPSRYVYGVNNQTMALVVDRGAFRRVTGQTLTGQLASPQLETVSYEYDTSGNIKRQVTQEGNPSVGPKTTQCNSYDGLRQLTQSRTFAGDTPCNSSDAVGGTHPFSLMWLYNDSGGRTMELRSGAATTPGWWSYSYSATKPHQLATATDITTSGGKFALTYNADGAVATRTVKNSTYAYTYTPDGAVDTITGPEGGSSYVRDADGQLLLRRDPTETTLFLDGMDVRVNKTTQAIDTDKYYTFNGAVIARRLNNLALEVQMSDLNGTNHVSVAPSGWTVERRYQDPFGNILKSAATGQPDTITGRRTFLNKPATNTGGLVDIGPRQYDPQLGQFLSVDPIVVGESARADQGYTYALNNPITNSDPSGLRPTLGGTDCGGECGKSEYEEELAYGSSTPSVPTTASATAPTATPSATPSAGSARPAKSSCGWRCGFANKMGAAVAAVATVAYDVTFRDMVESCLGGDGLRCAGELAMTVVPWGRAGKLMYKGYRGIQAARSTRKAAKGADEAGALVRYDPEFASRNLLGQLGEGYARTPSSYTVSAHAAERIVYGAPGRSPTTLGRVDDILNNPTRSVMRPDGSIRVFQGKDWVAVRGSGPIHIITVMVR